MPNLIYGPEIFEHKLAQLYVGFFNRVPDEKGFRYHLDAVDNNAAFEWDSDGLQDRATQFSEAIQLYAKLAPPEGPNDVGYGDDNDINDNELLIRNIYKNVMNNANPDQAHVDFWLEWIANNNGASVHEDRGALMIKMINDFVSNDPSDPSFGLSAEQQAAYLDNVALFQNKVQAGVMAVDNNYNPSGSEQAIYDSGVAVAAFVTKEPDSIRTALDNPSTGTIVSLGNNELNIVVAGQSNGANFVDNSSIMHDDARYNSNEWVQFFDEDGNERPYSDQWKTQSTQNPGGPGGAGRDEDFVATGASGYYTGDTLGGSMMGRLGDKLISDGPYDKVTFDTQAVGGSAIATWADENSAVYSSFASAVRSNGTDAVLFIQGETDALINTSYADYYNHLKAFIDNLDDEGVKLDLFVAQTATYVNSFGNLQVRTNIANAQDQIVLDFSSGGRHFNTLANIEVHAGPNYDDNGAADRDQTGTTDLFHFDAGGAQTIANEWAVVIFPVDILETA